MTDKQIEQHPIAKQKYELEMSEEDKMNFAKELEAFLKDKLGNRTYACFLGYEIRTAGIKVFQPALIGIDEKSLLYDSINCLKCVAQHLNEVLTQIGSPLQKITPDNNPIIKQEQK